MSNTENDKKENDSIVVDLESDSEFEFPETKFVYIKKSISPEELEKIRLRQKEK